MWKCIYERAFDNDLKISLKNMKKRINMLNIKIEYLNINENVVGFCLLYKLTNKIWHIDYIAIDPIYQNKGYGKLLLNIIIKKYKYLSLECENYLINYYKKFNFNILLKDYYYHGFKLYLMTNFFINNKDINTIIIKLNNYNVYLLFTLNILLLMIINYLFNNNIISQLDQFKHINFNYYDHVIF